MQIYKEPPLVIAIDDDRSQRMLFERALTLRGFNVKTFESIPHAIQQIRAEGLSPDALLMDGEGIGMDSLQFKTDIQSGKIQGFAPGMTIEIHSAGLTDDPERAIFAKPVHLAELANRLKDKIGEKYTRATISAEDIDDPSQKRPLSWQERLEHHIDFAGIMARRPPNYIETDEDNVRHLKSEASWREKLNKLVARKNQKPIYSGRGAA